MSGMQDALLKAGMISEKDIKKVEKEKQKEQEKKEFISRYPKNRFGRTPPYVFWLYKGKVPKNHDEICHFCGRTGVNIPKIANPEEFIEQGKGLMEAFNFSFWNKVVARTRDDALFQTFNLDISNGLGIMPLICRDCGEYFSKKREKLF